MSWRRARQMLMQLHVFQGQRSSLQVIASEMHTSRVPRAVPSTIGRLLPAKHLGRSIWEFGVVGAFGRVFDLAETGTRAENHTIEALELSHEAR